MRTQNVIKWSVNIVSCSQPFVLLLHLVHLTFFLLHLLRHPHIFLYIQIGVLHTTHKTLSISHLKMRSGLGIKRQLTRFLLSVLSFGTFAKTLETFFTSLTSTTPSFIRLRLRLCVQFMLSLLSCHSPLYFLSQFLILLILILPRLHLHPLTHSLALSIRLYNPPIHTAVQGC